MRQQKMRQIRRLLITMVCLCMAFLAVPTTAHAAKTRYYDGVLRPSYDGGIAKYSKCKIKGNTVTISGKLDQFNSKSAFKHYRVATTVRMKNKKFKLTSKTAFKTIASDTGKTKSLNRSEALKWMKTAGSIGMSLKVTGKTIKIVYFHS